MKTSGVWTTYVGGHKIINKRKLAVHKRKLAENIDHNRTFDRERSTNIDNIWRRQHNRTQAAVCLDRTQTTIEHNKKQ